MNQLLLVLLCFFFSNVLSASTLKVIQILPAGNDVYQTRQITIKFNQNVISLGRMERNKNEVPVVIKPFVNCDWRWLDKSTLACNLGTNSALKMATKYYVEIKPEFKTEAGEKLEEKYSHEFITQRPKVGYISFHSWKSPGHPVLYVSFNQPVGQNSVKSSLAFKYGDKTIQAKVTRPENRTYGSHYIWRSGRPYFEEVKLKKDYKGPITNGELASRYWLIEPVSEFPLNTDVSLEETPGLMSAFGKEKGIQNKVLRKFSTFPAFRFVGVSCYDVDGKKLFFEAGEKVDTKNGKCNPINGSVSLEFTSPVLKKDLSNNIQLLPTLTGKTKDFDPWNVKYDWSKLNRAYKKGNKYYVSFPDYLKVESTYQISGGENIKDEFGRRLGKPINLSFMTSSRRPNWNLIYKYALIEKGIGNDIPLVVTNLNNFSLKYSGLTAKETFSEKTKLYTPNIPRNVSARLPLKLDEILDNKSGVIYGKIESNPFVKNYNDNFFAQSTQYQIMVKFGHFNTLLWVTDMRTGENVKGAKVEILKGSYTQLSSLEKTLASSKTNQDGISLFDGMEVLDPNLNFTSAWRDDEKRFFVKVIKGDEMALLPLDYNFKVDSYRLSESGIYSSNQRKFGHVKAWGMTPQGVYRTGDKIQYKIYVRNQGLIKFQPAPKEFYDLKVLDPMNKVAYEKKGITLNEFGSFSGEFKTSKTSPMGHYQFILRARFKKSDGEHTLYPLKVLVTDFRPSSFRVESLINGERFEANDKIKVETTAKLHSGGPYVDAESRVTIKLKERPFTSSHPAAKNFNFLSSHTINRQSQIYQKSKKLNSNGISNQVYKLKDQKISYGKLYFESAVRDDRGKFVVSRKVATYLGVDKFVGLKNTKWTYQAGKKAEIEYLVVDPSGKPHEGNNVEIKIEYKKTFSSRVKGSGNAYVTKYTSKMITKSSCSGKSLKEKAVCSFVPDEAGEYKITAIVKDSKKRKHESSIWAWVTGNTHVVWESSTSNALTIIPEKENLKVGDRAKYLVKNPFPKSKALITLERYGVIKQWVQSFNTSTPIVEFDITEDLIPGFYLSVAIFSPRVSQLKGFDKLDLGKPTFKIGYVRVPIKDQYKDLVITTKTDKSVYKPREKVKVSVSVKERFPSRKKKPIEVAVAVLDESVFDLIKGGSSYYNPYWGFYDLGDLDVSNYSLLTRILGRQKFDKKGANQGGGGAGSFKMRSIFKYVSYWNPSLKLKNGQANFEVTLPDNLTGWKIITMGVTPEDKMGLGESSFKVNRKTEIQAATPNQVTEGDEFVAAFTVMNRMEKTRKIKVTVIGAGDLDKEKNNLELTKELMIKPFKRELINFKVKASDVAQLRKNKHGEASFMVKAGDKYDQDALYHKFPVLKRRSLISAVSYGSSDSKKVNELIALPKNTHSDVGNISVTTAPTVLGTLEGSFNYLKEYPYNCWEQKLTKAVMASHYNRLKKYIDTKKVPWENSEKVIKEIILDATNFQAPNGAMVYYIPQNQYVSPYLSAYTALGFHWLKQAGHLIPNEVEEKLHSYLLQMLRKDIFPSYFNEMMISTVRSVALAALALEQKISEQEILRYESHFKNMSLFGKAHYLLAASVINGKSLHRIQKMASDDILSAATISAGKYSFNEVSNRTSHRILSSPLRSNCSILSAYVKYLKVGENKKHFKDIPYKIINYLTQSRKNRARWENTQENMFCMNAFVDYARNYENIEPNFKLSVKFAAKTVGESEVKSFRTPMQIYDYPFKKENIGKKEKLEFIKSGKGRFYYTTRISYAPKGDFVKRQNAGIDIRKEYQVKRSGKWQKLNSPFKIKKGELIKVDIFISIPTARNFVVVNDPIPGGLEPINKDLATSSIVDLEDREFMGSSNSWFHKFRNWNTYGLSRWSFYHRELRNSAAVFYSEYLSPGNYYLSYNTQAIASGKFVSQPVHAEEMYNPDIFGKGVTGQFEVRE